MHCAQWNHFNGIACHPGESAKTKTQIKNVVFLDTWE